MQPSSVRLAALRIAAGLRRAVPAAWAALALSAGAQPAQEPASVQALRALDALLGPAGSLGPGETIDTSGPALAAAAAEGPRQRVVVRRGETLDAVIRRALGDLPVKEQVLRGAFVEVNPQVFRGGSVHRLAAGTELLVPTPAELRRHVEGLQRATAATQALSPAVSRPPPAAAPPPAPDTRRWIRYP